MANESENELSKKTTDKPKFIQRFNIEIGKPAVYDRFINRIINMINNAIPEIEHAGVREEFERSALNIVASELGDPYHWNKDLSVYIAGDFYRCMQAVETLYNFYKLSTYKQKEAEKIDGVIKYAIATSEIDLGIKWHDGNFSPSGAKLLDKTLVDENLDWLMKQEYDAVVTPFKKGLNHFLEAHRNPEKLADTLTDMYESLEAMVKITCGNDRDLSGNKEQFISKIKLSNYYKKMLGDYIEYANQYRHAAKPSKKRRPPKRNEVEAFFYTTGLFIRLSIQQLNNK